MESGETMWEKSIKYQIHISIFYQNRLVLMCFVETFMCHRHNRVELWAKASIESEKKWNRRNKNCKRVKAKSERDIQERGEKKLFYSGSMETINYRWYNIKYPSRFLRENALNNEHRKRLLLAPQQQVILIYCARFSNFWARCEVETVKIYCASL